MTEDKDTKIRDALRTLADDPETLDSLLSVSGSERRARLVDLGLGDISRDDVQEFLATDEVASFGMVGRGGPAGGRPGLHGRPGQGGGHGGPPPRAVEWVGAVATLAAGALA